MKKSILYICLFVLMTVLLGVDNAYAYRENPSNPNIFYCTYGSEESGTWEEKVEIEIDMSNYTTYVVNGHGMVNHTWCEATHPDGKKYVTKFCLYEYTTRLFDTNNSFKKKCPKILIIDSCTVTGEGLFTFNMYADGRMYEQTKSCVIGDSDQNKYKEIEYKGQPMPESERDCLTYDDYMDEIIAAKEEGGCSGNPKFTSTLATLSDLCHDYQQTVAASRDEELKKCWKACNSLRDDIYQLCGEDILATVETNECGLGTRTVAWIYKVLNWMRYIVPVLVILLGILDFIKAIAADNEDELKKAQSRFVKRLIAGAIVFLVPSILQFVFDIFHLPGLSSTNPFCK